MPAKTNNDNGIAVIGMSCRFPDANSPEEFWKNLVEGKDSVGSIPSDRWYMSGDEDLVAGYLKCPLDEFDSNFFNISPKEAPYIDPQQRLFLEVGWESIENARIPPSSLIGTKTGVWLGVDSDEYFRSQLDPREDTLYKVLGNTLSAAPGRMSFFLNLTGPSVAIAATCASSAVAVHLACASLRNGDCGLALAGGVNTLLETRTSYPSALLSTRCKAFDVSANGFAPAEGCGVLVLKRLEDALASGDNVLATIEGSAQNHTGKSSSFGTPNYETQEQVVRDAMKAAGVTPSQVTYYETHGTGTAVGDPTEITAIRNVYSEESRSSPLILGSVKTNIGHALAAAGVSGLIKMILCMKYRRIPKHLHLKTLNPALPSLDSIPAMLPLETMAWAGDSVYGAVSCFGITGTNVHFILKEGQPAFSDSSTADSSASPQLVTFSANDETALESLCGAYKEFLGHGKVVLPFSLADFAYSVNTTRTHQPFRLATVATSIPDLITKMTSKAYSKGTTHSSTGRQALTFLFTGHGCQYFGMAQSLYESSPAFKDAFDACSAHFLNNLGTTLQDYLWLNEESDMSLTKFSQPAIFSIQYCLLKLWESYGVRPDLVLGHSIGEFAACVAAGILSFEDGMRLVVERSRLADTLPPTSRMIAVGTTEAEVKNLVSTFTSQNPEAWIDIATVNSTHQTVVSISLEALDKFTAFVALKVPRVKTKVLASQHGFHSRAMDPILDQFRDIASKVQTMEPVCTYVSGTLGRVLQAGEVDGDYWVNHLRNTVSFSDAADLVLQDGNKIFVEIGPQPVLLNFIMANNVSGTGLVTCPSIRSTQDCRTTLLGSLAKLYVSGAVEAINFEAVSKAQKLTLPTYTFNRKKCWASGGSKGKSMIGNNDKVVHPLLGAKLNIPQSNKETRYYSHHNLTSTKYIRDHVIADNVVVPAAAYLEMILALGREIGDHKVLVIENLTVSKALYLDNKTIALHTLATESGSELRIGIHSDRNGGDWIQHAGATVRFDAQVDPPTLLNLTTARAACSQEHDMVELYRKLRVTGLAMGDQFKSLHRLWHNENKSKMLVEVKNLSRDDSAGHVCHPIVLDAMVQTFWQYKMIDVPGNVFALPVGIGKFTWYGQTDLSESLYVHVTDESGLSLHRADGLMLAKMEDVAILESTRSGFLSSISIKQQLPQFMTRNFAKIQTATTDRVLMKEFPALSGTAIKANLEIAKKFVSNTAKTEARYGRLCYLYIMKALTELGWSPTVGEPFSKEVLLQLVGKNYLFDPRVFEHFRNILQEEGILRAGNVAQKWPALPGIQREIDAFRMTSELLMEYTYIKSLGEALPAVLRGSSDPVDAIFNKNGANVLEMYTDSTRCKHDHGMLTGSFQSLLQGFKFTGTLRILEVGGGTGGATSHLLPLLEELGLDYKYTFTDVGLSFLPEARKRFSYYADKMAFEVLDIEKDPKGQGFVPHAYDIVIASHVVHVAADLGVALRNIRHLLAQSGLLFLVEITEPYRDFALSFDLLRSFWKVKDQRSYPIVDSGTWIKLLGINGFVDSVDAVPLEGIRRTVIIGRAADSACEFQPEAEDQDTAWLLFSSENDTLHEGLDQRLQLAGRTVFHVRPGLRFEKVNNHFCLSPKRLSDFQQLSHVLKNYRMEGLVYTWGLMETHALTSSSAHLRSATENSVGGLLNTIKMITSKVWSPRLYLVTGDVEELNPNGATLWGLLDTYLNEYPANVGTGIDIDLSSPPDLQAAQVFGQLWSPIIERGTVFKGDQSYAARLQNMDSELPSPEVAIPKSGRFKLLEAAEFSMSDSIGCPEGFLEVAVGAVGLNFRDILLGSSFLEGQDPGSVGLEFAGTVTKAGRGGKVQVGDRVVGLSNKGSVASHVCMETPDLLFPIPRDMSFIEAATLPVAYGTSYLSLVDIAKVRKGERVLIHTGTGGVGLSGIQLAHHLGAEVFVTAGTAKKRNYLRKCLGIKNVYDSRHTDYSSLILKDTNGLGVDIVINTLTGPGFKEATLQCLARGGRFIELSKLNVWKAEDVNALRPDAQYTILDAFQMISTSCPRMVTALEELGQLFGAGKLRPLPATPFPLSQIKSAFQFFARSQHIGKIVLQIPESPDKPELQIFRPESAYMVTGGLGGLGLEVTKFVAASGGNVVIVGRKEPTEEALKQLRPFADRIQILQADIGDYEQCETVLAKIKRPLRGIIHCAGVFSNGFIINQPIESFSKVFQPKVYGTWNLHQLTKGLDLDLFVTFSSIASLVGSTGLGSYTGANRYMDSLIAHRVDQLGLKGQTINWGPWDEVGAAAGYISGMFKNFYHFSPQVGILSLDRALRLGVRQTIIADMDPNLGETTPRLRPLLSQFTISKSNRERSGEAAGGANTNTRHDGRLETLLAALEGSSELPERLERMEALVEASFRIHAGIEEADRVDRDQPLSLMGMDSLIGMEMRTRLAKVLDLPIPNNAIQEHNSVRLFSAYLNEALPWRPAEPNNNEEAAEKEGRRESVAESVCEPKAEKKSLKPFSKFFAKTLRKFQLSDKAEHGGLGKSQKGRHIK